MGLFRVWAETSLKSFGGGQAVQVLAYNSLVDAHGWLSPEGWSETFGLVQIVPGINLVAFSLITGFRLAGWPGAIGSAIGLVGPSFVITVLITMAYSRIAGLPIAQAGIRGMVTAAAALSIVSAWRLLRPALRVSALEGSRVAAATVLIFLSAALLAGSADVPILLLLLASGSFMAILLWVHQARANRR